jgi:hypothetical protein
MWDLIRGRWGRERESVVAGGDAQELTMRAPALVDAAEGTSWYEHSGGEIDAAVSALCLLRRAASGDRARIEAGDEAVRAALEQARPEAVVWLASRVISFLDEQGFPEDAEHWLGGR